MHDVLQSARVAASSGEISKADEQFRRLIEEGSLLWEALGHRAWMLKSHGRYEEARDDYRRMMGIRPGDSAVRALAAECLFHSGKVQESMVEAAAILLVDPSNAAASALIVKVHERLHPVADSTIPARPGLPIARTSPNDVTHALETDLKTFPTSCFPEVGHLIYSIVRALRPRVAIETGAYIGYSGLCAAQAMEDNGFGQLHSFDIFDSLPNYSSPVLGLQSDRYVIATGHVEKAGLSHRVTFYKGDSSTNIRKHLVERKAKAEFAFIDGDHSIKGALKDWYAVDKCLVEGGIIMLHDTEPEKCHWLGPRFLLESIRKSGTEGGYQFVNLPTLHGIGVALIQKKSSKPSSKWHPTLIESAIDRFFIQSYWVKRQKAK